NYAQAKLNRHFDYSSSSITTVVTLLPAILMSDLPAIGFTSDFFLLLSMDVSKVVADAGTDSATEILTFAKLISIGFTITITILPSPLYAVTNKFGLASSAP